MTDFHVHCRQTAKEFIQNVIVIDDEFDYTPTPESTELDMPSEDTGFSDEHTEDLVTPNQQPHVIRSALDIQKLTTSFFNNQIVAGVFKPQGDLSDFNVDFYRKAVEISNKADGIILDWHLSNNNPNSSIELLEKIIRSDYESGGRLRVIVIYTSQPNLESLAQSLCERLLSAEIRDYLSNSLINFELDITNKTVYNMNVRVAFYSKDIDIEELPKLIINEFAKNNEGLLPTFALKAITAIRNNTPHLLTRFPKELDGAYLAHRAMIPHADDAEPFMLENFSSVIRNILSLEQVDIKCLGKDAITLWQTEGAEEEFSGLLGTKQIVFRRQDFEAHLSNGKSDLLLFFKTKFDLSGNVMKKENELLKQIATIFVKGNQSVLEHFSVLSSFKRSHLDIGWARPNHKPYLTQGTIICRHDENDISYFLCVTPKCDSVRIEEVSRKFSFFKLPVAAGAYQNKLHVIIKKLDVFVHLACIKKFYELTHIDFPRNDCSKRVEAEFNDTSKEFFFSSQESCQYSWIGDLKDLTTQAQVGGLVENINRVGVDEFEWFRISRL